MIKKLIKLFLKNKSRKKKSKITETTKNNIFPKIKEYIKKNKYFLVFALACILLSGFVSKAIIFAFALVLCALFSFLNRFSPIEIGFELVNLFTICFAIVFGPFIGITFGVILMIIYLFASDDLRKRWSFIPLICIIFIGYFAGIFPYEKYFSIAIFGFLLTMMYDGLFDIIFNYTVGRVNIVKRVFFWATHLYFNYLLFLHFGDKIIALLV